MHPKCKQAVNAIAGKELTEKQFQTIENDIKAAQSRLARERPDWQSLTADERLIEGAKAVMDDIKAQAQRKLENAHRQITLEAATQNEVQTLRDAYAGVKGHDGSYADGYRKFLLNLGHQISAESNFAMGQVIDLLKAAGDKTGVSLGKKFLMYAFDVENRAMTRDVVREVFKGADGHTGNKVAQAAARSWLDTVEQLRTRFNAAGGDIAKLAYGWVPQPHDIARIRKAGVQVWTDKVLPLLDRSRYVREDGMRMSDDEVRTFLGKAYDTLSTDGLNQQEPGQFHGTGARANRGSDARQLHFADGEAWLAYHQEFGKGSLFGAMQNHLNGITRDIVLIETMGPDSAANHRLQMDLLAREDGTSVQKPVGTFSINPQTYFDMVSGKAGTPVDETLARRMASVRAFNAAKQLGGAIISSFNDVDTVFVNTGYNRLPYWRVLAGVAKQLSKENRDWMTVHGMVSESLASHLGKFSGDSLGTNWATHLAASVMRGQFLQAWTNGWRQGFVDTMSWKLAQMAKKDWGSLYEFDRKRFTLAGISENDWKVLNSVTPDVFRGNEMMTPQAIKRSGHENANTIAAKVFGFIHNEGETAVINPDMAARAFTTWGTQAGTKEGEIARTVMQYKSFPAALVSRFYTRLLEGDLGTKDAPVMANRAVMGFSLMAGLTVLGAISVQVKQILAGKDPIDMNKGRFWAKAAVQGGALSIAGDLVLVDPQGGAMDTATTGIKNIAGPTIGDASELVLKNLVENMWQGAEGKDTHWEAELLNFGKRQVPGAGVWWVKPFIEHGLTNELNEALSPGYSAKVQQRAAKDWGQRFWWRPQDTTPQRAPDMAAAMGH